MDQNLTISSDRISHGVWDVMFIFLVIIIKIFYDNIQTKHYVVNE